MNASARLARGSAQRVHTLGLLSLVLGVALGLGLVAWLAGLGTVQTAYLGALTRPGVQAPKPATGLIERSDNRGQVLFGRYCDSCHPAGLEARGDTLRSVDFKRKYATDEKIVSFVRAGGFTMQAYDKDFLADEDLVEISAYIRSLPQEDR